MASASSKVGGLAVAVRVIVPVALGSAGYAAYRNLPFAWTYRVFYAIVYHNLLRKSPDLTPRALFKPMISETRAPLLELDYNLHKSNSTYFTDLDVARTHLVSYLARRAMRNLAHNHRTGLVLDPRTGRPARGPLGIMLGSVACSFRREIRAYRGYELWTRVLAWDRKWLYVVTHFLPRGTAKPTEWLDPRFAAVRTRSGSDASGGWEAKMHAAAVSKYVFKLGRFTVHPAIVLADAGLLPDRPGGWRGGDHHVGDEGADLGDVDLAADGDWDWRRVEAHRRRGMEMAAHLEALDGTTGWFDGGTYGALAKMGPC
ncbi:hypothetical protein UVI_02027000 [Ustilaginoidea virens]|uniref:Capsule polysaccharide biosynthesis protein n=1 Tax=Ustilaginoidea virens TaxID=1159556 RepID=A0A1B5L472_USTVR|nr:hypothetical protein UVI_02027000 [Ustilaginoidea virens]